MFKRILSNLAASTVKPDLENLITDFSNTSPNFASTLHIMVLTSMQKWPEIIGSVYAETIITLIKTPASDFTPMHYKSIAIMSPDLLNCAMSKDPEIGFGSRFWLANLKSMQFPSLHPLAKNLWYIIESQENTFLSETSHFYEVPRLIKYRPLIFK
jgi:hypothetical protein